MKKRIIGLALALCLMLSALGAQAAPARDMRAMEITVDERMQALTAILAQAIPEEYFSEGVNASQQIILAEGQAPDPAFVAQALCAAALLTRQTDFLSVPEAEALFSQLFAVGEMPGEMLSPFLTKTEAGFQLNDCGALGHGGAHIYSAEFDGTNVLLRCDLYFCEDADALSADVETLPEDMVTWTNSLSLSLRYAPETEFGCTVLSAVLSPYYQAGALSQWQAAENTEYEYSLQVPSCLGVADDDPACRVWQSADGAASLTIRAREKTDLSRGFDQAYDALEERNREEKMGLTIRKEPEFCRICALGEGQFLMLVVSDDLTWDYEAALLFPAERQAEYELYAEFIRNSLIMWGISNG